jgi:hypothetical protein
MARIKAVFTFLNRLNVYQLMNFFPFVPFEPLVQDNNYQGIGESQVVLPDKVFLKTKALFYKEEIQSLLLLDYES